MSKWSLKTDSRFVDNTEITINEGSIYVGRDSSSAGLVIKKNEISRQHAELKLENNVLYIKDLDSSNGTFINGAKIPPNKDVPLSPSSKISFEEVSFVVHGPTISPSMPTSVRTSVHQVIPNHLDAMPNVNGIASPQVTALQTAVDVMVSLSLIRGFSPNGQVFNLDGLSSLVIGRSVNCDIVLSDPTVSGEHVRLNSIDSSWEVVNLSHTNGLFINGNKVLKTFLRNNDELAIGGCILKFSSKISTGIAAGSAKKIPDWMRNQA